MSVVADPQDIPYSNLVDTAMVRIEELIFSGRFTPGEQLKEVELSEILEMSRGTIREALRRNEARGLVSIHPNRGAFVRKLTLKEEVEIFDMRAELSAYAARLVTDNLSPAFELQLKQILSEMDAAINDSGVAYYDLNLQFHDSIMVEAGNRRALNFYRNLVRESYFNRRRISLMTKTLMARSNAEHYKIVEAISSGDATRAAEVTHKHVMDGKARLISSYSDTI